MTNAEYPRDGNVLWLDTAEGRSYPALSEDMEVDVAIVGGGMVGLHSAWALRDQGLRVAVIEARRIARQATGRSTAKVTSQHGLRYAGLARDMGEEKARLHAQENEKALLLVKDLCGRIGESAGFETRDAFVYATDDAQVRQLESEAEAARAAGIDANVESMIAAPVDAMACLKFPQQGQFDPFGYLHGLAGLMAADVRIFEHSRVESLDYGTPSVLSVNGHAVRARHVVVATQMPVVSQGHFFAKAYPFAHAVAAAPLPESVRVEGMYISAGTPSHSFRTASRSGRTFLVAAGGEYKPGEPDKQRQTIEDLQAFLRRHFGIGEFTHLWTNEDFRPMDGSAFIGDADGSHPNLHVATGFAAWGITQGVVAGELIAARILGREHPAASLYDATRLRPLAGGAEFVKENMKAGSHLVGDRVLGRKSLALGDILPGEGGVVSHEGKKLAVRRDNSGNAVALSAVCTHLGCVVDWNPADRTWDCPCHGSRYDEHGTVLAGPATAPLEAQRIDGDDEAGR